MDKHSEALERRVEALEREMALLKSAAAKPDKNAWLDSLGKRPWDALDEEAAELGRKEMKKDRTTVGRKVRAHP